MLDAAIETVTNGEGRPLVHSDRPLSLGRLANTDQQRADGSLDVPEGLSQDNAASEGFFGRLKTELFYPGD